MKSIYLLILALALPILANGQDMTAEELLAKSIAYHDPNGVWRNFKGTFQVVSETPKGNDRTTEITIDMPEELFYVKSSRNGNITEYTVQNNECDIVFNGSSDLSKEILKENRLSCRRAETLRDYYTYLYGLPMKLRDPGTNLAPVVTTQTYRRKEYLVLWVTYDVSVGSDVWTFYFDPETYAMELYKFYKGDPARLGKDTGEYILLDGEETINGIKMPKVRTWFYNKDDKYVGTDTLFPN